MSGELLLAVNWAGLLGAVVGLGSVVLLVWLLGRLFDWLSRRHDTEAEQVFDESGVLRVGSQRGGCLGVIVSLFFVAAGLASLFVAVGFLLLDFGDSDNAWFAAGFVLFAALCLWGAVWVRRTNHRVTLCTPDGMSGLYFDQDGSFQNPKWSSEVISRDRIAQVAVLDIPWGYSRLPTLGVVLVDGQRAATVARYGRRELAEAEAARVERWWRGSTTAAT